jgi:hypothetical protein
MSIDQFNNFDNYYSFNLVRNNSFFLNMQTPYGIFPLLQGTLKNSSVNNDLYLNAGLIYVHSLLILQQEQSHDILRR